MPAALILTFGGGGDGDSGLSGGLVVLLFLVAFVAVPIAVGLALRRRDARRGEADAEVEPQVEDPAASGVFDSSWGRDGPFDVRRPSTRSDWLIVGAFAVVVLVLLVATQV